MPTLTLDARWLSTGLGTYTLNLVRELKRCDEFHIRLLTLPEHLQRLSEYGYELLSVKASIYSAREQIEIAWAARGSTLLHVPHYNAPLMYRGPLVVTIHDLNHILDTTYRKSFKSLVYARPMLRAVAVRSDHIFTVSEYSRRQIIEHLGVDGEKIAVVYNGIAPHIFPEPRSQARTETERGCSFTGPYVLFVGNLKPSKNVAGLLNAFAKSRSRLSHRLLIVGDDAAGRPTLTALARKLRLEDSAVFAGQLSGSQLRNAYCGADLTVLPSFEEGFGLPVLESMACGTPVACSRAASLPEVAGEAAEYFDPHDVDSIASSMEKVLQSSDRWAELQRLGIERAGWFTPQRCAERHFPVYRQFLKD